MAGAGDRSINRTVVSKETIPIGRLFMNKRKNNGLRTVPCGSPNYRDPGR